MGHVDYGGGPAHEHGADGVSVADLTGPADGEPDVAVELAARAGVASSWPAVSGSQGYTLNGTSPGPGDPRRTRATWSQVTLTNVDVPDGVTLHWHGVDVPNAEDGVAGVTQDAVAPGQQHVYRFVAEDAGTYWYHSHQVSHAQVRGGLFGTLVVLPADAGGRAGRRRARAHLQRTADRRRAAPGSRRWTPPPAPRSACRVVNTDNGPLRTWVSGGPFRVVAVDGAGPQRADRRDRRGRPGHRRRPGRPARHRAGPGRRRGRDGARGRPARAPTSPRARSPTAGSTCSPTAAPAPLSFDPEHADRRFEYRIGRRIGLHRRQARLLVDDQRQPLPRRPDVPRRRRGTSSG